MFYCLIVTHTLFHLVQQVNSKYSVYLITNHNIIRIDISLVFTTGRWEASSLCYFHTVFLYLYKMYKLGYFNHL